MKSGDVSPLGPLALMVSGSFQGGWLNQTTIPSQSQLTSFLTAHGVNFGAGYWGGVTWSPGNGTATQLGFATPQVGASYNYSYLAHEGVQSQPESLSQSDLEFIRRSEQRGDSWQQDW